MNTVRRSSPLEGLKLVLRKGGAGRERGVVELPRGAKYRRKAIEILWRKLLRARAAPFSSVRIGRTLGMSHDWRQLNTALGPEQRAGAGWSGSAELFLEDVVPVVADFAHCFQQVFELFVVEAGQASQCAHHDLFTLRVDRECRVGRR